MPNFTLTPPFFANPNTFFPPTETVLPLLHITPPFVQNPAIFFGTTATLLPLLHVTPPFFQNPVTFFDVRVFQIIQPDQVLKNEVRRTYPLEGSM
jgi:hypothetical protein